MSGSTLSKSRISEAQCAEYAGLRRMMRGYTALKKTGGVGRVREMKDALAVEVFPSIKPGSQFFWGAARDFTERAARQFLLQSLGGRAFNRALLRSIGSKSEPMVCAMPQEWCSVVEAAGFRVDREESRVLFQRLVRRQWWTAFRLVFRSIGEIVYGAFRKRPEALRPHAFFIGLDRSNLPRPGILGTSYDIINWYARWRGKDRRVESIYHRVAGEEGSDCAGFSVAFAEREFPRIRSRLSSIGYAFWALLLLIVGTWKTATGAWWYAFLLVECANARRVRLLDARDLALEYLFHFSGSTFRPLWTYEAQAHGSRILCYFYTTYEQPSLPDRYVLQGFEFHAASWPVYLVWDSDHAAFIERETNGTARSQIVGTIWFRSAPARLKDLPPHAIAVFDQEQHRPSSHFGFSTLADYLNATKDLNLHFLEQVYRILREFGFVMAFKRKRNIGSVAIRSYGKFCDRLREREGVVMVDPDVSPIELVQHCQGVISMPFTSTALYPVDFGIPSVYFDPSKWIRRDDRAAHNIPVLLGESELRIWAGALAAKMSPQTSGLAGEAG